VVEGAGHAEGTLIDIPTPGVFNGRRTQANFPENLRINKEQRLMKRTLIWCLITSVLLVSGGRVQAQKASETEKVIVAQENQWEEAENTANPNLLAPLLADKFVNTSSDGKVTGKAEALEELKSFVKGSASITSLKVVVFGGTAMAYGVGKAKVTDASGKITEMNEHWTDTWVKMPSGKWQCVAEHLSPAKA
jgi:ketosteroid isomerase-like protein